MNVLSSLEVPVTLARAGLVGRTAPHRIWGQLAALIRWGTTLSGTFVSAAAREPGRVAIIDDGGALTYAELNERTDRLAAALGATGTIGVLCRNHRGLVESLVTAGKLGADAVLLNTGMGAGGLAEVMGEQGVDVLIADAEFDEAVAMAPASVRRITSERLDDLMAVAPRDVPVPPKRSGRTIVLSSGTTGRPKGARRPPRPGLAPLASILSRIPLRVHDTVLIEAPLFHTWGYAALQMAAALRATIVLRRRFDPEVSLRTVTEHGCTVLFAVPVMAQRLLEVPPVRTGLRVVALSGSSLPGGLATAFMDAYGDVLYNLYGSTETSWVSIATPADLRSNPETAGRPPRGTRLAVLGDDGEPVPPGRPGRIFVANELPFDGYTGGQVAKTRDGMLPTGDIGHVDEEGRLYIDGRSDDMIVSGGENVFPRQVEAVLTAMPEVREAAVVGVPDEEFGQRLAAYVVLREGAALAADTVRSRVRERTARFAVPREVYFLAELPRNATGKILTRELRDRR